jgi:OOP family OmpA-OmpF porin
MVQSTSFACFSAAACCFMCATLRPKVKSIFIYFFLFIFQHQSLSQIPHASRYPFDITDPVLKEVHFTPLSIKINSVYPEVRPLISANGKLLFFCRRNHPANVFKAKDSQDIWVSSLGGDGTWGEPQNLGENINTKDGDAICSVNEDGSEIYFISEIIDTHRPLMRSVHSGNGWGKPVAVEIENFYNQNDYIDFFGSSKSKVLILAIQQNDSKGDQDLYVCFPTGENKWSSPVNLGEVVNSEQADFSPFLAADGKTLFFSSYGHEGLGGCDIFQTKRLDNTWKNWSKPKNLGKGINSPREESNFSVTGDNKQIYFESYDLKREVRDIFMADLPKEFFQESNP